MQYFARRQGGYALYVIRYRYSLFVICTGSIVNGPMVYDPIANLQYAGSSISFHGFNNWYAAKLAR